MERGETHDFGVDSFADAVRALPPGRPLAPLRAAYLLLTAASFLIKDWYFTDLFL